MYSPDLDEVQASEDAAAGMPAASAGAQGGATPSEQRCTFLELALALGPGLDARGVGTLFRAALPGLQVGSIGFRAQEHTDYGWEEPLWVAAPLRGQR